MNPRLYLLLVGLASAALIGAAAARWLDPEPAVYEAALADVHSSEVAVASAPSTCDAVAGDTPQISPALTAAFLAANAPGAGLGEVSGLREHVGVANSRKLAALEAQGFTPWRAGRPEVAVLRFSRVGFLSDRSEALFCIRAAHGSYLVHELRDGDHWVVAETVPLSAS